MELIQVNEDKMLSANKGYFIYEMFYTNTIVTRKHKSRDAEHKKRKKLRKSLQKTTKIFQIETKGKKLQNATRKKKIKYKY